MPNGDEIGALYFSIGVDDDDVTKMLNQLDAMLKKAQAQIDRNTLKLDVSAGDGFKSISAAVKELVGSYKELATDAKALAKVLESVGKGGSKPLSDGQKAARAYSAELKALFSEQRAGLKTQGDTVNRIKAITTELGKGLGALDRTSAEYSEYANALDKATTTLGKLEAAQRRTDQALETRSITEATNAYGDLRLQYENLERSQDEFIAGSRTAYTSFQRLRDELDLGGTSYKRLTDQMKQVVTGIATAEDRTTRLGLSQQVAVGHTARLSDGIKGLGSGVVNLGNALPGVIGVAGFGGLLGITGDLATEANALNVSYDILNLTLDRTGQSGESAQAAITEVAETLGVAEGQVVDYITQLTRVGFTTDEAAQALIAGGASAFAFGKTAAQGMDSVTSALVTQNSQALNTIGIAENIGKAMGDAADGAAEYGEAASQQAAAQAGLEVILKATGAEVQSLDKLTGGLAGQQNRAATAAFEAKQALGEMLIPIETLKNEALAGLLGQFQELPGTMQAGVLGFGGVTTAAAALTTGLGLLRSATLPLLSPPTGIFILGATAAIGLGTAIYNAAQKVETSAEKFKKLQTEADDLAQPLRDLQDVTSEDQLQGAISALADTMEGEAKDAFVAYADSAVETAETTKDAVIGLYDYVLNYRKKLKEDALVEARQILDDAQADLDQRLSALEQAGPDNAAARQLAQDQAELRQDRADLIEEQGRLQKALDRGDEANTARIKGNIASIKEDIIYLEGEVRKGMANLPEVKINIATDARDAALRTVRELEGEVTTLNDLLANGTRQEINAYLDGVIDNSTAAGRALQAVGDDARQAFRSVAQDFKGLADLDAPGANQLLGTLKSLKETYPGLKAALNPLIDDTNAYIASLDRTIPSAKGVGEAADDTATYFEKALKATEDYTFMLSQGVQQGVRPFDGAMHLLTTALERQETQMANLAKNGKYGENFKLAQAKADELRQTIEELTGIKLPDPGISAAYGAFRDILPDVTATAGELRDLPIPEVKAFAGELRDLPVPTVTAMAGELQNLIMPDVSAEYRDFSNYFTKDLPKALKRSAAEAELFGKSFNETAEEADLLREKIEELLADGMKPSDKVIQDLAKRYSELQEELKEQEKAHKRYQTNLEATKEAQEALGDASSVSRNDIDDLIASLTDAAEGTGVLGEQARSALADLEALAVARDIGSAFQVMGDLAAEALEYLPEGANVGTLALGGLISATDEVTAALQDGKLDWKDAFDILSGAIEGVIGLLGDDVPAEVNIAGDAISGVFSGAAAGATFGPFGAIAGAVIGGLVGLFGGITEEQKRQIELQEEFNEKLEETSDLVRDIQDANNQGIEDSEQAIVDSKLEAAEGSGKYEKGKGAGVLALAQLKSDFFEAYDQFQSDIADAVSRKGEIQSAISSIDEQLRTGIAENGKKLTEAEMADLRALRASLATELGAAEQEIKNYQEAYGYEIGALLEQSDEIAKQLGLSQQELYEALFSGNDAILGQLTGEQIQALRAGIGAYVEAYGELPPGAEEAAAALGISVEQLEAEMLGSGTTISGAAITSGDQIRAAASGLADQLISLLGPEAAGPIIDMINAAAEEQATALEAQGTALSTAAGNSGAITQAALDDLINQLITMFGPEKAGPIIDLINQTSADMAGALDTQGTTLSTQADTTSLTIGNSLSGVFGSVKDAIRGVLPDTNSVLSDAFALLRDTTTDDSRLLALRMADEQYALTRAQESFFRAQKDAAREYGPLASAELSGQVEDTRDALKLSLYGSNGFSPFLTSSTTSISNLLGNFFDSQRSTVTRQAGLTVGSINDATGDIRRAMNALVGASSGFSSVRSGGSSRGGGGSGSRSSAFNYFTPLHSMFDDRIFGGMGSEFDFDPMSVLGDDMEGRRFGYGTVATIQPVPDRGSDYLRSAGPLAGLLGTLRVGVESYKKGAVASLNSARQTVASGMAALTRGFESDVQTDSERTLRALAEADRKQQAYIKRYGQKKVKASEEAKKAYAENKKALLAFENDTFDLISGRALTGYHIEGRKDGRLGGLLKDILGGSVNLIKGLTSQQQEVLDFAKGFGTALENSVSGGIGAGIKDALKSGGVADFADLMQSISGSVFDGLFDQISGPILQKLLGPLLTDLTADVTRGDVNGASANVQQIAAKIPAIAAQLQAILAPLQGILGTANTAAASSSTGGITLEQRSLGSASPTWVATMTDVSAVFSRAADRMFLAGERQYAAAVKLESAVTKQVNQYQEIASKGRNTRF